MANFQEKVTFIWDLADLLRGVYKRNEYQKIILPFTVLKRFDSVLSDSKEAVLEAYNKYKKEFENIGHALQDSATDKKGNPLGFYNYSKYDFKTLLEDPKEAPTLESIRFQNAQLKKYKVEQLKEMINTLQIMMPHSINIEGNKVRVLLRPEKILESLNDIIERQTVPEFKEKLNKAFINNLDKP